jgi:hypothetical protein
MASKRSEEPDMSTSPIDNLQLKALEQRAELHQSASELREQLSAARNRLRISKQAREHLAVACGLASLVALFAGFGIAGVFVRN